MRDKSKPYHHGNLPVALMEAGLALLAEGPIEGLSLRAVARRAGVSPTAVYRHFPDRDTLVTTLAAEGLLRLSAAQHEASDAAGGGVRGFAATGVAYVQFAIRNPALFRLIFAEPPALNLLADPPEDLPDAMAYLRVNATEVAHLTGADADVVAIHAWSLVHGLAMLILDKQMPIEDAMIARVVESAAVAGAMSGRTGQ